MLWKSLNTLREWLLIEFRRAKRSIRKASPVVIELRASAKDINLSPVDLKNPSLVAAHLKAFYPNKHTFHIKDK